MKFPHVILFGALSAIAAPHLAMAEPMSSFTMISPQGPVVNLTVSESTEIAPDIAYLTLSITSRGRDKALAMQANKQTSASVLAAIKAASVADKDIETQWFNVDEDIDWQPNGTRRRKGFVVSNSLRVTVRKLDSLADLIAATSTAGATETGSPDFDVENKTPTIDKLTRIATEKAKARAVFHAQLNGYTGAKLISVSDEIQSSSSGGEVMAAAFAPKSPLPPAIMADASPDIHPQQVNISVRLIMSYEMTK